MRLSSSVASQLYCLDLYECGSGRKRHCVNNTLIPFSLWSQQRTRHLDNFRQFRHFMAVYSNIITPLTWRSWWLCSSNDTSYKLKLLISHNNEQISHELMAYLSLFHHVMCVIKCNTCFLSQSSMFYSIKEEKHSGLMLIK